MKVLVLLLLAPYGTAQTSPSCPHTQALLTQLVCNSSFPDLVRVNHVKPLLLTVTHADNFTDDIRRVAIAVDTYLGHIINNLPKLKKYASQSQTAALESVEKIRSDLQLFIAYIGNVPALNQQTLIGQWKNQGKRAYDSSLKHVLQRMKEFELEKTADQTLKNYTVSDLENVETADWYMSQYGRTRTTIAKVDDKKELAKKLTTLDTLLSHARVRIRNEMDPAANETLTLLSMAEQQQLDVQKLLNKTEQQLSIPFNDLQREWENKIVDQIYDSKTNQLRLFAMIKADWLQRMRQTANIRKSDGTAIALVLVLLYYVVEPNF